MPEIGALIVTGGGDRAFVAGADISELAELEDVYQGRELALAGQDQPWLKETADYMRIRVALNQSQQSAFDDWGTLDRNQIDQAAVQRAEQFIADYRSRYPEGRYLDSANGLLRRLAWFKGDEAALAGLFQQASRQPGNPELLNEIDLKLLMQPGFTGSSAMPQLTLVQDLRRLRLHESWDEWQPLQPGELAQQNAQFASNPAWLAYLQQAERYYLAKDYAAVIAAAAFYHYSLVVKFFFIECSNISY